MPTALSKTKICIINWLHILRIWQEKFFSGQIHRMWSHFIIPIFVFQIAVGIWKLDMQQKVQKSQNPYKRILSRVQSLLMIRASHFIFFSEEPFLGLKIATFGATQSQTLNRHFFTNLALKSPLFWVYFCLKVNIV